MPASRTPRRQLSRRALLGGLVAGAAATAGCTPAASRPPAHGAGSRAEPAVRRPRALSPDVAIATTAAARVRQTGDLVGRVVRDHPRLRRRLAALSALHAAHLRMLQDAVPAGHRHDAAGAGTGHRVPRRAEAALAAVVRDEHALRSGLEALAVQAQSGEFARLLAAMSAAVGQQLVAPAGERGPAQ